MKNLIVTLDNTEYAVKLIEKCDSQVTFEVGGKIYSVNIEAPLAATPQNRSDFVHNKGSAPSPIVASNANSATNHAYSTKSPTFTAPMPGVVVKLLCSQGDTISVGQPIIILEAMKMENAINSPTAGILKQFLVTEGQQVESGQPLAEIA